MKKSAFTLAEILVTITIIGIVAMQTIPTLVTSIRNQDTVVRLKKVYSELGQASKMFEADGTNILTVWQNDASAKNYFCNKLSCIKTGENSFPDAIYEYLDGSIFGEPSEYAHSAILNDGTLLNFYSENNNCTSSWGDPFIDICGVILVDINGFKGPNKFGRDTFQFVVLKTRTSPVGCSGWDDCTTAGLGHTCAYKVLAENAINY